MPNRLVPEVQRSMPPARSRRRVIPRFLVDGTEAHAADIPPADPVEEPPQPPLDRDELRHRAGEDVPLRDDRLHRFSQHRRHDRVRDAWDSGLPDLATPVDVRPAEDTDEL